MKSLVLDEPNKLRLAQRPVPEPGIGDVLLRIVCTAICHTDLFTMEGGYKLGHPTVLGHEFSGIVEKCGPGVTNVKIGDRVTSFSFASCGTCPACREGWGVQCPNLRALPRELEGSFQEKMIMPASSLFHVPATMGLDEACLVEPASCAYNAVDKAAIQPGETVVVIGAGPIGLFAVQAAALRYPSKLIVSGKYPNQLAMAKKCGATHVVDVQKDNPLEIVMGLTGGRGVDAVLFCAGGEQAWTQASSMLGIGGRFIVEAMPPTGTEQWPVPVMDFTQKVISYIGASSYNSNQYYAVIGLIDRGKIDAKSLITHRFSLDEYQEALRIAGKAKDQAIKVIFEISKE
ncbi:MAG: alcohol dehydrogenase catalytic domain-containing protein [Verrucomicrobia bacterium]|nr:alcohol dehydrogenase catalytic domain-containing protein [Verrucomicrobiota bacterium]